MVAAAAAVVAVAAVVVAAVVVVVVVVVAAVVVVVAVVAAVVVVVAAGFVSRLSRPRPATTGCSSLDLCATWHGGWPARRDPPRVESSRVE